MSKQRRKKLAFNNKYFETLNAFVSEECCHVNLRRSITKRTYSKLCDSYKFLKIYVAQVRRQVIWLKQKLVKKFYRALNCNGRKNIQI